ncbi:hypothetical protein FSP39_020938 [Pinctada imbricata]|uniref:Uncharacterized protein n=1 Tax=Pinctada imbricata TaxID=66713 RepID=A0AA89BZN6_PINIB|nr:hypothetical protein FSP39_020938 [Pinctada imbricata]
MSNACINEMVKPSRNDGTDYYVVEVGRELYPELADIMSQRLKDHDYSLFKCDLFALEEFVNIFTPKYQIPGDRVDGHLIYFFKYGRIFLAKKLLDSKCLTIDGLDDRTFLKILKESSVHNQLHAVQFLVHEKTNSSRKTNAIIECMDYISLTDKVSAIFVQCLSHAVLDQEQLMGVSRVITRDESWKIFEYFINNLQDANNDQTLEAIGKTIGRRNARKCRDLVLNKFRSEKEEIASYIIEGACNGGNNNLIIWAMENYPELMNTHAAKLLKQVEIPTTLEVLLQSYSSCFSAQNYNDALNALCAKGKSLCVKVLIDRWSDSTDSDIENALRAALLGEHFGTVNIIRESFSIPHDMITEIIGSMRGSGDMRPHSAYRNTSTPRPPSVLSRKNYTPCIYEETQKRNNRKLCVMRCLSKQYLTTENNIYSRAYRLSSLIHDNDMQHESKLQQCQALLAETPKIYEDLVIESAVYSCCTEEFLFMFLMKYPNIWKQIFLSCPNDTKRRQSVFINLQKIYKKTGEQFLPTMFDFLVQINEDIPAFMTAMTTTECIVDIEEFISALETLIVPHQVIAEILLEYIEELTLHTSTIVPLKISCKRNRINVFKFIWMRTKNQNDIISHFLSKDIVDQNCEVINIMLSDITSNVIICEIFAECLHHRSSRWLSTLSRTHREFLLDSFALIISAVTQKGYNTSLEIMIQVLKLSENELNDIFLKACEKGWKIVIKELLKMEINITGRTIVKSIETLSKNGHRGMVICFEELLKNEELSDSQYDAILNTIMTCREISSDITYLLQRLVLIPSFAKRIFCFASQVFFQEIISIIGIDFLIMVLSVILDHFGESFKNKIGYNIRNLGPMLTVSQENQIIGIILETSVTSVCFSILADFLPRCRELDPYIGRHLIHKVFPEEGNSVATYSKSILLYIFENCSSLMQHEILLKNMMTIIKNNSIDINVKISIFEMGRKRAINISSRVTPYFHELCKEKNCGTWRSNEEGFIQYLMDNNYLDRTEIHEGIKSCLLGDEIYNQVIARMILKNGKASLTFDIKDIVTKIFTKICEYGYISIQLVECVLELYSNDIDDLSLEVGFRLLLRDEREYSEYWYIRSKIFVDTLVGRTVDIGCHALSIFNIICDTFENDVNFMKLLKYILERYTDLIAGNVMKGLNNSILKGNISVALELCRTFPGHISVSECIILWFLEIGLFDNRIELLSIELSSVFHIDREMCIKLAKREIQKRERWNAVFSLFGSSITLEIKWKLLNQWLTKHYCLPYWLSEADMELTYEQVINLERSYTDDIVRSVLKLCKVK